MASQGGVVLPGQGWMISRTTPDGIETQPIVAWVYVSLQVGLSPMSVFDGGLMATMVKNPFEEHQMIWHPDQTTRAEVEGKLAARNSVVT